MNKKVAIEVSNEAEYRRLMKFYETRGWKWNDGELPLESNYYSEVSNCVDYHNNFGQEGKKYQESLGYTIIPFATLALLEGLEVKPSVTVKLTDSYNATIHYDTQVVEVGCQKTIPFSKVKEVYELTINQ